MAKYRKKPVVIEAEQFHAADKMWPFGIVNFGYPCAEGESHWLEGKHWVTTMEGPLVVSEDDYIIRGIKGEFYPCKPDIFEATYDHVEE